MFIEKTTKHCLSQPAPRGEVEVAKGLTRRKFVLENSMTAIDWLTVSEAAREAKVSEKTIRRWYRSGRLRADRLGSRTIRIRRCELVAMAGDAVTM